jgi:hypothetical protein
VGQRALVGCCNGHAFGTVNGRSSAHGNQAIAFPGAVGMYCVTHSRFGRVGGRLVKHRDRHAGQGIQRFLQHAGGLDSLVGDD